MLPIQERGIFKTVDALQLETLTGQGWRLVAVLDNQSPMAFSDMENMPAVPAYSGGPAFMSVTNNRYHDVRTQTFLLVLDEESAIAGLKAEIAAIREKLKAMGDVEKKLAEMTKDRDVSVETAGRERDAQRALTDKLGDTTKTLETYKAEVAETLAKAKEIIEAQAQLRKTAYERVAEGEYDDGVESVEERDVG